MGYKILLVEDNPHIMEINTEALEMEDYEVFQAVDGKSCMELLKSKEPDMVVLDIMLPDTDGLKLCREIKAKADIPILFLSALSENRQIVEGLKTGGDDYLPKPYDIGVLLARVEARLRDSQHRKRFVNYRELKLDTISMTGSYDDKDLLLTQKEFLLLRMLSENITGYTDPDEIYRNIWGGEAGEDHNAIYTTVSRLNKKLDSVDAKLRVAYSRGDGYALEEV